MRLSDENISKYAPGNIIAQKKIADINPLLQNNYGGDQGCTLTSITTVIKWLRPDLAINTIYNEVERIARKYGYHPNFGTLNIVIPPIFNLVLKSFRINKKTSSRYLKDVGYCYRFIRENIDTNKPVMLNLWKDGRDYYKNHTVLIIGYREIEDKKMLAIYDNWYKSVSYIDYDKLSIISSIVYLI